jgi:hypothetical protein
MHVKRDVRETLSHGRLVRVRLSPRLG